MLINILVKKIYIIWIQIQLLHQNNYHNNLLEKN